MVRPNSANIAPVELYLFQATNSETANSVLNPSNIGKNRSFIILRDKIIQTQASPQNGSVGHFRWKIKLKDIVTQYNGLNLGDFRDIAGNALYLVVASSNTSNNYSVYMDLKYTDI